MVIPLLANLECSLLTRNLYRIAHLSLCHSLAAILSNPSFCATVLNRKWTIAQSARHAHVAFSWSKRVSGNRFYEWGYRRPSREPAAARDLACLTLILADEARTQPELPLLCRHFKSVGNASDRRSSATMAMTPRTSSDILCTRWVAGHRPTLDGRRAVVSRGECTDGQQRLVLLWQRSGRPAT